MAVHNHTTTDDGSGLLGVVLGVLLVVLVGFMLINSGVIKWGQQDAGITIINLPAPASAPVPAPVAAQ